MLQSRNSNLHTLDWKKKRTGKALNNVKIDSKMLSLYVQTEGAVLIQRNSVWYPKSD